MTRARAEPTPSVVSHPGQPPAYFANAVEYEAFLLGRLHQLRELERAMITEVRPPYYGVQLGCGFALAGAGLITALLGFVAVSVPHNGVDDERPWELALLGGTIVAAGGLGWGFRTLGAGRRQVRASPAITALRAEHHHWNTQYQIIRRAALLSTNTSSGVSLRLHGRGLALTAAF